MASLFPTVVFVPGAFASASCFDDLAARFRKIGYATAYADVPSLNPTDPTAVSASKDAEHVRNNVILPLVDEGKDLIIFVHSYGGVVGGTAAAGLSKTSRLQEDKAGGVIGLLYLVGNIVGQDETLLQAVGGAYPPFIKQNYVCYRRIRMIECLTDRTQPSQRLAVIEPVMETLYNDADATMKSVLEAGMIPHSLNAFETPAGAPAWAEPIFQGRRAYIRTIDDQCNPLFLQEAWLKKSGVEWEILDLKSSHCPFITQTETVAALCADLFPNWMK